MNHHIHSGNSSTIITKPNGFENRTTKMATSLSSHKLMKNGLSVVKRAREISNHDRTTNCKQIDFDALESIPFDDIGPDKLATITTGPNLIDNTDNINNNNDENDNNAPISAVLKKLTNFFLKSSTHKTLINLKSMHSNRNKMKTKSKQIENKINKNNNNHNDKQLQLQLQLQLGDPTFLKHCEMNNIENCAAVATVCHRKSVSSIESIENKCCTEADASTRNHSSDRISSYSSDCSSNKSLSANKMCRDDEKHTIDNSASAVSPTWSTKHQKELSSIEKNSETFSLPRVSLRQSSASPTSTANFNQRNISNTNSNVTNQNMNCSNLDNRLSFGDVDKMPSSHYSTEKSGSSGYYSSNVYSTSSVEDHIYSEPIIDGNSRRRKFEVFFDQQAGLANLEQSIKTLEKHLNLLNTSKTNHASSKIETKRSAKQVVALERRAENADQKRLPTIVEGLDNNSMAIVSHQRINQDNNKTDWNADSTDDSLMDLNLDTFQLIHERCDKRIGITKPIFQSNEIDHSEISIIGKNGKANKRSTTHSIEGDVGNESIYDNNQHSDMVSIRDASIENIENNYKCTKYINSCPDDAYNVDEIIDYKYEHVAHSISTKSMPFHMKNFEDHIKQQNTKDILEEIRDKLEILLKPIVTDIENESSTESDDIGSSKNNSRTISIERNISALKRDVDNYLILMNQQNEMEIRAFCSGLSKNYKLLTIQHALNNRMRRPRISTSDFGSEVYSNRSFTDSSSGSQIVSRYIDYHQSSVVRRPRRLKNQRKNNQKWKNNQLRHIPSSKYALKCKNVQKTRENVSIRCSSSSDSNFRLQRRHSDSLCSSWDEDQQIVLTSGHGSDSIGSVPDTSSTKSTNSAVSNAILPIEDEISLAIAKNEHRLIVTLNANALNKSIIDSIDMTNQTGHMENNLAMQQPSLITIDNTKLSANNNEKDIMLEWHRNKPSIWQQYYGSKRLKYSNVVKKIKGKFDVNTSMAYPSTRPETDFTLDLPRAEQLRVKMQQEKKSRCRCRLLLVLLGLIFFLMTVIMFSLMLSSGKRMFGSMA